MMLTVGAVVAIFAASVVVFLVWNLAAAGLVFVFGTALAVIGNPAIWAAVQRDAPDNEKAQ